MQKELIARGEVEEAEKLRTPFQGEDRQYVHRQTNRIIYTNDSPRSWKRLFAKSIIRPFALFFREPIIQLLGVYMAFVYGILYLVLTTLPSIYQGVYHENNDGVAGLHYIALGVGLTGGESGEREDVGSGVRVVEREGEAEMGGGAWRGEGGNREHEEELWEAGVSVACVL